MSLISRLSRHERSLWIAAILFYGFGDFLTTMGGLTFDGVAEAGPIVGPAIETKGVSGYLIVKSVSVILFVLCWSQLNKPNRTAIPLAVLVVGTFVTLWNIVVILVAIQ